jgi:hypothetical protein
VPLSAIGAVLRHASVETTMGYAKVGAPPANAEKFTVSLLEPRFHPSHV